jgi:hypothetical protein
LAAELSDAAYQIALRHGLADSWIDLELGLWRALATKVRNRGRRVTTWLQPSDPRASNGHPVRLPR